MTRRSEPYSVTPGLYWLMAGTLLICLPGVYFGISHGELPPWLGTALFGMAIFGAAFLLSWAAEVAQVDISESLAVAILALLAVMPEYAVDFVFAWKAAHDPQQAHYAIANMTGANRLLVGLGWPMILFLYVWVRKKPRIVLDKSQRVEIFYLAMATLYSFTIPLKGNLNLIDTVILVSLFGLYVRRAAQLESKEPELVGPPKIIANFSNLPRRISTISIFLVAGLIIILVAEPFAVSLVAMGADFGIDEFLLVQWLAPIASESPEFIIAATWTLRGNAGSAMRAIISSKVNQWTLLIGTIPLVYAISGQAIKPFMLDSLQKNELILTAAQSLFAVALLVGLRFERREAILLLVLFSAQLFFEQIRIEVAIIYGILAVIYIIVNRKGLLPAAKGGLGIDRSADRL